MLTRFPDWPARLTAAVEARRGKPFVLGRTDCVPFVCDCVLAMTGVDLAAKFRGTYRSESGALRQIRKAGADSLESLVETTAARLGIPEIPPVLASSGDVVLTRDSGRASLGISLGRQSLFAGRSGMAWRDTAGCSRAWRI